LLENGRLTFAADFFGDWEAPYDHNVVRRFREAGFVIVGSTTLPEWGILPWTNTKRFGPTRKDYDAAMTFFRNSDQISKLTNEHCVTQVGHRTRWIH